MSSTKPFTELLSAIVDNRGRTCPTSEEGIPLIATNCVNNDALYPAYDKVRYVSQETYDTWFRGHPEPGDLIFVTKGSPGRVCMAPDPVDFCIAQDMVAVRPDPQKVYPKYLFAALRSHQVQQAIGNMHVGTLIPHFKKGDFDKLDIPLPDSDVQEAIGEMYYSLSAKIELNRRMNETLEAMARAIFKSWFVDFDPVRAKASGEPPESICHRLGLTPDVLALFPDSFQDSELGEIPKGWIPKPFGDWLSHTIGGDWGSDTADDQHTVEVRIIRGTDMPKLKSGMANDVPCRFVQPSKLASRKLQPEDIVLEVSGGSRDQPTGRGLRVTPGIIALLGGDVVPASFCRLLRPTLPMAGPLLSLHLDSIYEAGKTWEYQNQSTGISNFQTKYFLERELVIAPSTQIIAAFYEYVSPMLSGRYSTEIGPLSAVRDTLLPQLMSGELVVPGMEASQ